MVFNNKLFRTEALLCFLHTMNQKLIFLACKIAAVLENFVFHSYSLIIKSKKKVRVSTISYINLFWTRCSSPVVNRDTLDWRHLHKPITTFLKFAFIQEPNFLLHWHHLAIFGQIYAISYFLAPFLWLITHAYVIHLLGLNHRFDIPFFSWAL